MKYADASALLRILFSEEGPALPLEGPIASSRLVEVECFRALDRQRLVGILDDPETALKRKELTDLLTLLDLAPIDDPVLELARQPFGVNVRAVDALHVATAQVLAATAAERLEFWTHDERQALAAQARGLDVRGLQ